LVFLDSWLFLFISGVLIFGVGLEYNATLCSTAIFLCIAAYGTSKLFIYLFLIERVHVVWGRSGVPRLKSPVYIVCLVTVTLYGVVAGLLIFGRVNYFRQDGACVVGLKKISSLSLLIYDLYVNIFLTTLFLRPLLSSKFLSIRVKRLATRTLIASGVALTTSTINVVVLTVLKGEELGWICLGSCGTDVLFNALAIYWVTGGAAAAVKPSTATSVPYDSKGLPPDINGKAVDLSPPDATTSNTVDKIDALQSKRASVSFARQKPTMNGKDNARSKGTTKSPSLFKSLKSMISKKPNRESDLCSGIQITVTTEYEMDIVPRDGSGSDEKDVQIVGRDDGQVV